MTEFTEAYLDAENDAIILRRVGEDGTPVMGYPQVIIKLGDILAAVPGGVDDVVVKAREIPICIAGEQKFMVVLGSDYYTH